MTRLPRRGPDNEVPFLGQRPFEVADGHLFFGRDREAEQVVSRTLSSSCTLLHAPSGAGKTSLLNSRIIPALERRGWTPVRIRFEQDPVDAIRSHVLATLLVPPAMERLALQQMFASLELPDTATLADAVASYRALSKSDPRKRALIRPVALTDEMRASGFLDREEVTPLVSRFLQGRLDADRFDRVLAPITGIAPAQSSTTLPCRVLMSLLASPEVEAHFRRILARANFPVRNLVEFFQNLAEIFFELGTRLSLILIFDQFEELFTQFSEPRVGSGAAGDSGRWRKRQRLLDEWRELVLASHGVALDEEPEDWDSPEEETEDDDTDQPTPLLLPTFRYIISIREEYIARLGPVRSFLSDLYEHSYYLTYLQREQAEQAIRQPVELFGGKCEPAAIDEILDTLEFDDKLVVPAALQIVCSRLWKAVRDASDSAGGTTFDGDAIVLAGRGNGVRGILDSYFGDFLNELKSDKLRREVLQILALLITPSRTRNVVEHDRLVNESLRSPELRASLIDRLVEESILRVERRHGSDFVEVMHEFLIDPILAKIEEDEGLRRLRSALFALNRFGGVSLADSPQRVLSKSEFRDIEEFGPEIEWAPWAVELMFRTTIVLGRELPDVREAITRWRGRLDAGAPAIDSDRLLAELADRMVRGNYFTVDELRALAERLPEIHVTRGATGFALRSALRGASDEDRDLVAAWTAEVQEHG